MPVITRLLFANLLLCWGLMAQAAPLRVVTEPWAPYVFVKGGQPTGLDYEIANEVFRRLGVEVRWEFLPWRRCLMMVEQGQADGVLDIFQTRDRAPLLIYPDHPLSEVEFVLFQANARRHSVQRLTDLRGLSVGTQAGFQYGPAFDDAPQFRREPAPTLQANLGKLVLGRIDLLITDRRAGRFAVKELGLQGQVRELPWVVARHPQYLALRRGAGLDKLMVRFDTELQRYRASRHYPMLVRRFTDAPR
ncbi:substrate-binding periplasmic protein [Pseudomonas typographi]|uniref:Transporter substrate-binding domain-containing protein n=1 Tax=Pseudomonas typographi TaxID=2715964 RepID=A0ABR7YVW6_9PSED|nr:transporter substrate-binding domain-containing protein [Pseudomonas typographi]MBD1549915.1 transporter substrate-binding domain-containing protein [Pseudomonas typographi]MBD1585296.1 transporter substrate-binding domain-containing protein [Pseudomonas typographi]MBD1597343.1 transporter substrate-binding domain-containing protein [Pseudomonas typographi]